MKRTVLTLMICVFGLSSCSIIPTAQSDKQPSELENAETKITNTEVSSSISPTTTVPVPEDNNLQTEIPEAAYETMQANYLIVDTGQGECYDNETKIECTEINDAFFGQDAQYSGNQPSYEDNGDGTVTDLVTGLMWQQNPGEKMTLAEALDGANTFHLAGYDDWRLPTIKELYSLILFDGTDPSKCSDDNCKVIPFIDTRYFNFEYGDPANGERVIDSQFATSTKYVSVTMKGNETMFGVNFADGRIKGYPINPRGNEKTYFILYVRGDTDYGINEFQDNSNATITDLSTNLTWMQADSGTGMNWGKSFAYCESLSLGGYEDWRLPDIKELQSIVDYSRSPNTSNSAAIDPIFDISSITNEVGELDFPFVWSSTTHEDSAGRAKAAAYISFGRAMGYMNEWMDVHGAGAQRSDPKSGDASKQPLGRGPQGDAIRIENYVRCVRGGNSILIPEGVEEIDRPSQNVQSTEIEQEQQSGDAQNSAGNTPPQEANDACSGLTQNAICTFNTPNGSLSGTCQIIQEKLTCVPER